MAHISKVIAWKHNNLAGMKTVNGVITKFPPGVIGVTYDGNGIPVQADQDTWTAEYDALAPTRTLEAARARNALANLKDVPVQNAIKNSDTFVRAKAWVDGQPDIATACARILMIAASHVRNDKDTDDDFFNPGE